MQSKTIGFNDSESDHIRSYSKRERIKFFSFLCAHLSNIEEFSWLFLSGLQIGFDEMNIIRGIIRKTSGLTLERNKLDEDILKGYGGVVLAEELPKTIKYLNLFKCYLSKISIVAIGNALRNSNIEQLGLSYNPNLSDVDTFNHFVNSVREMPKLVRLYVRGSVNELQHDLLVDMKKQLPNLRVNFYNA